MGVGTDGCGGGSGSEVVVGGHVVGPFAGGGGGLVGYDGGVVAEVCRLQVISMIEELLRALCEIMLDVVEGHIVGPVAEGGEGLVGYGGGVVADVGGGQVFIKCAGDGVVLRRVDLPDTLFWDIVLEGNGGHVIGPVAREGGGQVFIEGVVVGGEGGGILK